LSVIREGAIAALGGRFVEWGGAIGW